MKYYPLFDSSVPGCKGTVIEKWFQLSVSSEEEIQSDKRADGKMRKPKYLGFQPTQFFNNGIYSATQIEEMY